MLVRIMTEPRNSIYNQFREIFSERRRRARRSSRKVFEQIAELALEYKTGARSLRGIFEELITPILYEVTDRSDIARVVVTSLFNDPVYMRKGAPAQAPAAYPARLSATRWPRPAAALVVSAASRFSATASKAIVTSTVLVSEARFAVVPRGRSRARRAPDGNDRRRHGRRAGALPAPAASRLPCAPSGWSRA